MVEWDDPSPSEMQHAPRVQGRWIHVNFWSWPKACSREYFLALAIKEEWIGDTAMEIGKPFYTVAYEALVEMEELNKEDE